MEKQNSAPPEPLPIGSEDDFRSVDLQGLLADLRMGDRYSLESALSDRLRAAEDSKDEGAVRALRVLSLLCTFHLTLDVPNTPYISRINDTARRSCLPSDFRGEQNEILAKVAGEIGHPALRARVSDVVWLNSRKQWQAGVDAITAYCEVVENRVSGEFGSELQGRVAFIGDAVDYIHRALEIAAGLKKSDTLRLRETFVLLYKHAQAKRHFVHFVKLARLGKRYELLTWEAIAKDAERLVSPVTSDVHPIATHPVWKLASDAYELTGDDEAKARCLDRVVDETLRNREYVSLSARPHHTRVAIEELRQGGGSRERIRALQKELRELQEEAVDQAAQFSFPLDLSTEQQGTVQIFGELTLPDLLFRFGQVRFAMKLTDLRAEAEKTLQNRGVMATFGKSYIDAEGKVIVETPPLAQGEVPSDVHLKEQYSVILGMHRFVIVQACIEPARSTTLTRFALEERHFKSIVEMSPFVPAGHRHQFCLGFARFWQGDFPSALHILVPQLENSLRYVLLNVDEETSKLTRELTQEDRSLSGLLQSMRPAIDRIFGEDLANDIEMLFTHKPGPALRHELAHGQLADGECYGPDAIYACWLIYHLTVRPLAEIWREVIAPAIEAAAF